MNAKKSQLPRQKGTKDRLKAGLQTRKPRLVSIERYCVFCGCSDLRACACGCEWVVKFPDIMEENPAGICSSGSCLLAFFDDFGRTIQNPDLKFEIGNLKA